MTRTVSRKRIEHSVTTEIRDLMTWENAEAFAVEAVDSASRRKTQILSSVLESS